MKKSRTFSQLLHEATGKFCKHQGLPYGSKIQIRRDRGSGRQVRGDTSITRKAFGPQLDGDSTVASTLEKFLSSIVAPSTVATGSRAILVTPHEGEVHGKTLLRKVRGWNGLPTLV